jgi:peptidoglycan/xylan/chitin deacetylase (PgdA/CDA1 family)
MHANAAWTHREMLQAQDRFTDIFKSPALTHGAAGWQMSRHALRLTQDLGFHYCSDGRALMPDATPHFPVAQAEIIDCPQIPTTLPTLDELIGLDGCTETNVHERLLALTAAPPPLITAAQEPMGAHVFTLHAELEGMRLLPRFEQLLAGWKEQGYELVATEAVYQNLVRNHLPYFDAVSGTVPGRSGTLLLQGKPFLPASTRFALAA